MRSKAKVCTRGNGAQPQNIDTVESPLPGFKLYHISLSLLIVLHTVRVARVTWLSFLLRNYNPLPLPLIPQATEKLLWRW